MKSIALACAVGVFLIVTRLCAEAPPTSQPAIIKLEAFPTAVSLDGARDIQSIILRGIDVTGLTHDLTANAALSNSDPKLVSFTAASFTPLADGQSTLTATYQNQSASIPISVKNAQTRRPISFRMDISPALTRSGCNNGACHGSARGQDGFHLSLFGYDPDGDYRALTRELPGRRSNNAFPESSLMLLKATGQVPHTGGQRFTTDDLRYKAILEWLTAGSPADPPNTPTVTSLELFPQDIVLDAAGATQKLVAIAHYSDATDRDVTALTTFITNNDYAAKVSAEGLVSAAHTGEAMILARFDALTVGTQVLVVPHDAPPPDSTPPSPNYIDQLITAKLRKMRITSSPLCTDEDFLRRVSLDLTGLLPTIEEHDRFIADQSPTRREALIDALLQRKEFTDLWVMKWAERLGIHSTLEVSYKAMLLYFNWLSQNIAAGTPINKIVRDIIAADGGTFTNPATNFYQIETDQLKISENVAQSFLGTRIQCAQCHNHPFDLWKMDDYYGFAAFFSRIGRKPGEDPREMIIFNSNSGDMHHPVGGRVMPPKFLGGPVPDLAGRDRRAVLADWLTSKDNRLFAKNVANFAWAHFFGRGIVEPADDLRVSNPPVNAALLDALADHLISYDYDHRRLVRDICTSQAYQRSSTTNATNAADQTNFSHALVRRIRAESLLDGICQVTKTKNKFAGLPLGARAVQIPDGNTSDYFLTTFGRATRATVCTCEVRMEPNLSQALHLLNGESIHERIKQGHLIPDLLAAGRKPAEVLDLLYLSCLTRRPSDTEKSALIGLMDDKNPQPSLEDAFWALLNSREFMFSH